MDWFILDPQGRPVPASPTQWARDQANDPRWHIADDSWEAEEGWVSVDTKFLGFDPRLLEDQVGPPALFDSVAFFEPHEGEGERLAQRLYRSRPAALRGHEQLVQWLVSGDVDVARSNGKLSE